MDKYEYLQYRGYEPFLLQSLTDNEFDELYIIAKKNELLDWYRKFFEHCNRKNHLSYQDWETTYNFYVGKINKIEREMKDE